MRNLIPGDKPPHDHGKYHCPCCACECWRSERVILGKFYGPATHDPAKSKPGTIPIWHVGKWRTSGWSIRMEDKGIYFVIAVENIASSDIDNAGHLDCVKVLTIGEKPKLLVTSKRWLVEICSNSK